MSKDRPMRVLRAIASGLLTVLGVLGVVILWVIVLIALPLVLAGVLLMRLQNRQMRPFTASDMARVPRRDGRGAVPNRPYP